MTENVDMVNHPPHYNQHPSGVECIDIIEHMTLNIGNAVKYLWRSGLKENEPTEKDYRKAIWYIEREIQRLQKPDDPPIPLPEWFCNRCKLWQKAGTKMYNCCPAHNESVCLKCAKELHPEAVF